MIKLDILFDKQPVITIITFYDNLKHLIIVVAPSRTTENITEAVPSSNSIQLRWEPIANIPGNLADRYYGYFVKVSEAGSGTIVRYNTFSTAGGRIDGLKHNTEYVVLIRAFREYQGERKPDSNSYPLLTVKTNCARE